VPLVQCNFKRNSIHANGKDLSDHNNVHCDSIVPLPAVQRMADHCFITYSTAGNKPDHDSWRRLPDLQCLLPLNRFQNNLPNNELRDGGCLPRPWNLVQKELPRANEFVQKLPE